MGVRMQAGWSELLGETWGGENRSDMEEGVWEDGLIRLKGNVHFSRKVSVFGNTASHRTMPLLTARLLGK